MVYTAENMHAYNDRPVYKNHGWSIYYIQDFRLYVADNWVLDLMM